MTIEAKLDETNKLLGKVVELLTAQVSGGTRPPKAEKAGTTAKAPVEPVKTETKVEGEEDDLLGGGEEPAKELTQEDVRKHLVAYQTETSRDDVRILIKAHGAKSLPDLAPDKYAAIAAAVVKKLGADAEKKLAAAAASMKK